MWLMLSIINNTRWIFDSPKYIDTSALVSSVYTIWVPMLYANVTPSMEYFISSREELFCVMLAQ